MKVAVINFSGNVGKSTIAKHLLLPRMKDVEFLAVESINSDDNDDHDVIKGKQFGQLQEQLLMIDGSAIIDVGASNVEDFVRLMQMYRGSHEDFDMFIVPVVKETKQIRDTIGTIQALNSMGVPPKKIRVIFNKLEVDETIEDVFYPLIAFQQETKSFPFKATAVIHYSELYQRLQAYKTTIPELLADQTDYKAKLREAKTPEDKSTAVAMISMRRLAGSAQENLDAVYTAIMR